MSQMVYLVRHGQTPLNVRAVLHQIADEAALTPFGQEQIEATAQWLQSQKPRLKVIHCSTEHRARQSAEILAQSLGLVSVQPEAAFQERNWGDWAGKTWSEVEEVLEDFSLEDRYAFVPPKGESWQQFTHRLQASWWQIITATDPAEDIVIVTHGGVMRALLPEVLQLPLETSFMIQPRNGEVMTFELIPGEKPHPQVLERTDLNFISPHQG